MYKKILVPVDGSVGSILAVDHCIELAKKIIVEKIEILHVVSIYSRLQTYSGKLGSIFFTIKDQLSEYGEEVLAEAKKRIEENVNVPVETKLLFGYPDDSIVEEASKEECDLIVIGSRGLSGIESKLMGSVSNYVVHNAKCTVTVIKKKKA